MDEQALRKTIAENLTYFRRQKGLTQAALAETLNYSDKSVSKWERGEGIPDVTVLVRLADYYGISVNDLVTPADSRPAPAEETEEKSGSKRSLRTRILVPLLSIGLVWLAAVIAHFFMKIFLPDLQFGGLLFMCAVPASCIVGTVFARLWWKRILTLLFVSGIIWSTAACLFVAFAVQNIGLIFSVAGVLQVLAVLLYIQMGK